MGAAAVPISAVLLAVAAAAAESAASPSSSSSGSASRVARLQQETSRISLVAVGAIGRIRGATGIQTNSALRTEGLHTLTAAAAAAAGCKLPGASLAQQAMVLLRQSTFSHDSQHMHEVWDWRHVCAAVSPPLCPAASPQHACHHAGLTQEGCVHLPRVTAVTTGPILA